MERYIVLYNPASHRGRGLQNAEKVGQLVQGKCEYYDMTVSGFSFPEFVKSADPDRKIVITGGDGTLNYLLNTLPEEPVRRELFFYPGGSGNDFIRDLELPPNFGPVLLNPYLEDLPSVTAGGRRMRFLNGVGVGLDGFCCAEKARLASKGIEKSYTRIALEAVFGLYTPCCATVSVDGVSRDYRRVWMAPAMFGRYFGGGVKAAPGQDRKDPSHMLTSVVVHDTGRLGALFMFLFVCKGKGGLFPRHIEIRKGYRISVKLSSRAAIQVDGDVIEDQTEYEAVSRKP